jgi:hypothetical protein
MRAITAATAVFAMIFLSAVSANTAAPAVFATASLSAGRANTSAPAVFAFGSSADVRANAAAPAGFATTAYPAVGATIKRWTEDLLFDRASGFDHITDVDKNAGTQKK